MSEQTRGQRVSREATIAMKIEISVSDNHEGTDSPWWMIVKPQQNFSTGEQGIYNIAGMITGPFFSREEAELELESRRYNYGKTAVVFCASGYNSGQYRTAYRNAEAKAKQEAK